MQTASSLAKRLGKTLSDNSPVILTAAGVAGVLTTAVLTGKAVLKADQILWEAQETDELKQFELVWQCYIPPAIAATGTIAAIIGAQHISNRRSAALMSLYSLTDTAFREYKDKVVEQIGENKEQKVRDSVAQDRVEKNPPTREVLLVGSGDVLCYETMTGRYFHSNMENLRRAENDINRQINQDMYASLNEFWNLVGIPSTGYGDLVGWNLDTPLDLQFTSVLSENSMPALAVGYAKMPKEKYDKVY